ncbi:MAG: hypothetical protein A3H06_01195 [Candidatus Colwellbacteria bacterium RIFCSPLOWO2_12_FULL_44_13]|uniref:ZIP zinc transporter n=3 Tax=Candidatus Colwelliibacteriota TaxID=1817904 RepID=A0A1G1Z601_9BACT|nr:MAG: hypothetical protein A3F24_01725 [Candidatus Colwellbacteria bacterium RIFCSPHIGHO2_12_FULL_44_17]OGY60071.1 MAG: hypothetical protein A3I31_02955 [Candidatus Colwellbacteria bacterium RIFCSPLOWO2_02_FULL_44_20b]OGY61452.1 MAG: hypothetical protein A3H06_01195 [Candidatus Colwellbacteria bacterium RIFCSPLOWO2_12_FULL_44_13]
MLLYIIGASLFGSLCALIGGVLLLFNERFARRISLLLVSFAAGSLMGAVFLDLLPEAFELNPGRLTFLMVLIGILALFVFEKALRWYHCHDERCDIHTLSSTALFGDALHNLIDGVVIALSFGVSVPVGVATTVAIFFHEVPQEIGDFGVLLHAGYSRFRNLLLNTLTALMTPVGALLGYFLFSYINGYLPFIIAFAAGSFIYIAVSDLLPELRHKGKGFDLAHLFGIIFGIVIIILVGIFIPE